jgi:hypothetical protein
MSVHAGADELARATHLVDLQLNRLVPSRLQLSRELAQVAGSLSQGHPGPGAVLER